MILARMFWIQTWLCLSLLLHSIEAPCSFWCFPRLYQYYVNVEPTWIPLAIGRDTKLHWTQKPSAFYADGTHCVMFCQDCSQISWNISDNLNANCQRSNNNPINIAHNLIDVLDNHGKRFALALYSSSQVMYWFLSKLSGEGKYSVVLINFMLIR